MTHGTGTHYDAVIVGSGFGGSVMAYRLAEAGMRVCLLERGKAYPPNGFPRAPHDLGRNFWDPSAGLYGLFNIWSFKGSGAVVSSGLGGGSLIYANVLVRKDEHWFKDDLAGGGYRPWPVSRADLDPHYGAVETMMNVQKYPLAHPPYDRTPKTRAMQDAARTVGGGQPNGPRWLPVNLAVSFRGKPVAHPDDDGADNPPIPGASIEEARPNYHAVTAGRPMPRRTCRLCGECDLGCNDGSKNTLDYTYISAAIHQPTPAVVQTLTEVTAFAPRPQGGYVITCRRHDPAGDGDREPKLDTLTCDRLILAAGALGTPYLLLKNQTAFPRLSQRIGCNYSVNGDLLSFFVRSTETVAGRRRPRLLDPSFGPVITSAIRFPDALDGTGAEGRGFYVEDGGHPHLLGWMIELSGVVGLARRTLRFLKLALMFRLGLSHDADLGAEIAALIGPADTSKSSMPLLCMGRDSPNGRLSLHDGLLDCDWNVRGSGSRPYYERVRRSMDALAKAIGATYRDNPFYTLNFNQVLTAHPLGGCPMAERIEDGVVDAQGEVFNYPGLYVVDGAAMPGPVGPNPSLTIGAFSDRCADRIIDRWRAAGRA